MFRILIVDDDIFVHGLLNKKIPWQDIGFTVVGNAMDGEEAYNMALETNPDVIISDVMMPGYDGEELLKRISVLYSNIVFIFLSGYESFRTAQIALKYSASDYILKPLDVQKLDYLTEELKKIASELTRRQWYQDYLHDEHEEDNIKIALQEKNEAFFRSMFSKLSSDLQGSVANYAIIHELLSRLYTILLEFEKVPLEERQIQIQRFNALKNWLDRISLVSEAYFSYLRAENTYEVQLIVLIKEYIKQHLSYSELSVNNIATEFGYSCDWLNRIFQRYNGSSSLSVYILEKRLTQAAELLRKETAMPIEDIACSVGYNSSTSFSRAFKRYYSMTPTEYRFGDINNVQNKSQR